MYLGVLGPTSRPRGLRKYIEAELVKQIDSYSWRFGYWQSNNTFFYHTDFLIWMGILYVLYILRGREAARL